MRPFDHDRPDAARSRRTLLLAIAVYLCAQLAVGLALDRAPLRVRFPQAAGVLKRAAALGQPPEVVFLGSSRFLASVEPDVVDEALRGEGMRPPPVLLNASVEAGDGYALDLVLRSLLATGARPRLALIEISPETLARRNGWMNAHIARQLTFPEEAAILPQIALSKQLDLLVTARLNPVYYYRRELLIWMTGRKPPFLRVPEAGEREGEGSGGEGDASASPEQPPEDRALARDEFERRAARGARHIRKWLRGYEISGLATQSLDRLLARCRSHGIEVVLVRPPVTAVHRAVYTQENESAFRAHVDGLTKRYGARYVDLRDRLPDDLFVDNHHTSAQGARVFSRLLAREVVAPSWTRTTGPP